MHSPSHFTPHKRQVHAHGELHTHAPPPPHLSAPPTPTHTSFLIHFHTCPRPQELALPIIENEVFGEVAEAKEVAQFAMNYKEAKKVGRLRCLQCCGLGAGVNLREAGV